MKYALRPELPPLPARMLKLPVDKRGYPVPWFVAWVNNAPDFRVIDPPKVLEAIQHHRCWVCGGGMGSYRAFTVGPMCAVNRISSEPPSHRDCAVFSAIACPFLTRPHMRRREGNLPPEYTEPSGEMIARNPGVALVWITRRFQLVHFKGKPPLFRMGDPTDVLAYAEGRPATVEEVRASIVSGLPLLQAAADAEGPGAVKALQHELGVACLALGVPPI